GQERMGRGTGAALRVGHLTTGVAAEVPHSQVGTLLALLGRSYPGFAALMFRSYAFLTIKNTINNVVEIPSTRTKRFASSFLIRTAKAWNALPSSVFPDTYNLGTFKSRVNRHLLGKRASS
ncbi:jg817, partial [Pararge aegeria aegeria]